jgi:hypothetical protein
MKEKYNNLSQKEKLSFVISLSLFIFYCIYVAFYQIYHEMWRDEVLPWIIARDMSLFERIAYVKYDGHPILWNLILTPFAKFGFPVQTVQVIHTIISIAIAYLLLFKSPFSILYKALLLVATPLLYLLPLFSRNYVIAIFFMVLISTIWKERWRGKTRYLYGVSLLLLVNTNAAMLSVVATIGLYELILAIDKNKFKQFIISFPCVMTIAGMLLYLIGHADFWGELIPDMALQEGSRFSDVFQNIPYTFSDFLKTNLMENLVILSLKLPQYLNFFSNRCLNFFSSSTIFNFVFTKIIPSLIIIMIMWAPVSCVNNWKQRTAIIFFPIITFLFMYIIYSRGGYYHERHLSMIFFSVVAEYWIVFSKIKFSDLKMYKQFIIIVLTLPILFTSIGIHHGKSDDKYKIFSDGKATARAIRDAGLDAKDTLIVTNADYTYVTVLGYLKNIKQFYTERGWLTYTPWQKTIMNQCLDLEEVIENRLNTMKYKHILFLVDKNFQTENRMVSEYRDRYDVLYESTKKTNESYIVFYVR